MIDPTPTDPTDPTAEALSQRDIAAAAAMPKLLPDDWPEGEPRTFEVPELPTSTLFFLIIEEATDTTGATDTTDITETTLGPFQPEDWTTDTDSGITYAHEPDTGEHIVLRCEAQWRWNNRLIVSCLDGEANLINYRVEEISDNTLPVEDISYS